eukprot:scaffold618_cov153-Skeletonema_menzelii.AAC.3
MLLPSCVKAMYVLTEEPRFALLPRYLSIISSVWADGCNIFIVIEVVFELHCGVMSRYADFGVLYVSMGDFARARSQRVQRISTSNQRSSGGAMGVEHNCSLLLVKRINLVDLLGHYE